MLVDEALPYGHCHTLFVPAIRIVPLFSAVALTARDSAEPKGGVYIIMLATKSNSHRQTDSTHVYMQLLSLNYVGH